MSTVEGRLVTVEPPAARRAAKPAACTLSGASQQRADVRTAPGEPGAGIEGVAAVVAAPDQQ